VKWKSEFLTKYDETIYLDADGASLTEAAFLERVVNEKLGFSMKVDSEAPKRMTIRLLSEAETRSAQADRG
jgi:hypothetical protein